MPRIVFVKAGYRSIRQHYGPPLGILSLASYLRDRVPDIEIKIIDMVAENINAQLAAELAVDFEPDVLGLSAMSYESEQMTEVAREAKSRQPGLTIVTGGPHATTATGKVLQDLNIDYVVRGEGEITFVELLHKILAGDDDVEGIEGLGFRKNSEPRIADLRKEIVDMDSLSLPAYDLVDLKVYWSLPRFGTTFINREYAPMVTSRACPYHCTYCHRIFGTRYRAQSPEIILRDMETLRDGYGVREVLFVDDCFNLDRKRVAAICDGIVERGFDFSIAFPNGLRGDLIDRETLEKLKQAGTYRITYAVETASPRLQKFIKKNVNLDKLKKVVEMGDELDIMGDGFFMVGFPGETRQEIKMTLDYAVNSKLHSASFWFVTPFEGTELNQQAKDMGFDVPDLTESLHYNDPRTDLSEVPDDQLKKMVQRTFLRFYMNPHRLWRILKLFPNKKQLPFLFLRFLQLTLK